LTKGETVYITVVLNTATQRWL